MTNHLDIHLQNGSVFCICSKTPLQSSVRVLGAFTLVVSYCVGDVMSAGGRHIVCQCFCFAVGGSGRSIWCKCNNHVVVDASGCWESQGL